MRSRIKHAQHLFLCLLLTVCGVAGKVSAVELSGHAKYLYQNTHLHTTNEDHIGNLRLHSQSGRRWQWEADYEASLIQGDSVASYPAGDIDSQWFDLSDTEVEDNQLRQHRLDRLNLAYVDERNVIRFGRQAVSWGNGLVFHPLDIFNPFSPLSVDKDYKPGSDMLYYQRSLAAGDDLQWLYLPRRAPDTGELASTYSSQVIKYHLMSDAADWDILLGRHYEEDIAGIGLSRALGESLWRLDLLYRDAERRNYSWITNIDSSGQLFNHNVYGFVEYHYQSLGMRSAQASSISTELLQQLVRGEIYLPGRDHLALGGMVELNPLWQLSTTYIHNLNGLGHLISTSLSHNWQQNLTLNLGLHLTKANQAITLGGLDTLAILQGGKQFYLQLGYYF